MGYEMSKMKGKRPDPKVKAEGEQKAPHKGPKMGTKAPAKKTTKKKM
jgi:hypothetical protein